MATHFMKVTLADGDYVPSEHETEQSCVEAVASAVRDPRTVSIDILTFEEEQLPLAQVTRLHRETREGVEGFASEQGLTFLPEEFCKMIAMRSVLRQLAESLGINKDQDADVLPF